VKKLREKTDLTNKQFGKWTVIKKGEKTFYWLCECECGTIKEVRQDSLMSGNSSCRYCLKLIPPNKKRVSSKHPIYSTWTDMKTRCNNPNSKSYKTYGEKGIKLCEKWEQDFLEFYDWAVSNGWENGLTIDRIDVNKGYSPDNCQWITKSENSKKRHIEHDSKGENANSSKLTNKEVEIIKLILFYKLLKHKEIGELFNVSHQIIKNISSGRYWSHIKIKPIQNERNKADL
jgi:hypothetical protein